MKKVSRSVLRKDWLRLNENNSHVSPFQQWALHDIIARHYLFFFLAQREWPCYFAFYKGKEMIMIAPLCKRYTMRGISYYSFGATPTIAFQDFIYGDDLTEDDMKECLELLYRKCKKLSFYNLPAESLLLKVLKKDKEPQKQNINFTIPLNVSYENYYNALDKHVRQNVRTAYNRMKTDEKTWQVELIEGKDVGKELLKEMMDVYVERRKARYRGTSRLHEWYLRHEHFNTIALSKLDIARYIVLTIDGKVAAFLAGYVDEKNSSLLIPRLAISGDYNRYSPGVVLINESMKLLENNMKIEYLDLSKGNDKYKETMGGVFITPTTSYKRVA